MPKPSGRSQFVETLRGIAAKHGLRFEALSRDWIIQLSDPGSGRLCSVFGYTFDINPAAAVEICKEKAATSLVLATHGVPNVSHSVFLSSSNPFTAPYVPATGVWAEIQALVGQVGFPVVLKPLKGTGGLDVVKATCWKEVEAAVQHIFSREYGLAISPFKRIIDEFRCICLDGSVELVYRKARSSVTGDGASTVAALLAQQAAAAEPKAAAALLQAASGLKPEELASVPGPGESVAVQWKHNLGTGARVDLDVPSDVRQRLSAVAVKTVQAIGMRFCSVDVVDVESEGLTVMEVNGGVMMDSLMEQLGDDGAARACGLYEAAVLRALGR